MMNERIFDKIPAVGELLDDEEGEGYLLAIPIKINILPHIFYLDKNTSTTYLIFCVNGKYSTATMIKGGEKTRDWLRRELAKINPELALII
jgi:hypothetical protein